MSLRRLGILSLMFGVLSHAMSQDISYTDIVTEHKANPYRLVATNVVSIALEAIGDGMRDRAWVEHNDTYSSIGHLSQALSIGTLLTIPLNQHLTTQEWLNYVISYIALRMAIFDPIYNTVRGLPWNYIGGSSYYDKILKMSNPPDGFIMMRVVAFSVGVSINF